MTWLLDLLAVARFECSRAARTWRALSLVAVYCVGTGGGAWLFVQLVGQLEHQVAQTLLIAAPDTPGALLGELEKSDLWRRILSAMVGSRERADALAGTPILALFHRWIGFLLVPMFAATTAAESLALDVSSRAIRYEALRTGRGTLVFGRFTGQLLLAALASLCGAAVVFVVGETAMVGNPPLDLALGLADSTLRAFLFAIPATAIGILASSLVRSAAWARVLALGAVVGSWMAYGACQYAVARGAEWQNSIAQRLLPLFPQSWIDGLWDPLGLLSPAVLTLLGCAIASFAAVRFATRDL